MSGTSHLQVTPLRDTNLAGRKFISDNDLYQIFLDHNKANPPSKIITKKKFIKGVIHHGKHHHVVAFKSGDGGYTYVEGFFVDELTSMDVIIKK